MKQPEIRTQRLLLRSFTPGDALHVQRLAGNYNVSKKTLNIPYPYESGMAEDWINTHAASWSMRTGVVYAITLPETDQLIGAISLIRIDGTQGELGYWIGEPYRGKGYCTEAAKALIRLSFEKLELHTIIAEHLASNPASGRVMEKSGMQYVGTTNKLDRNQEMAAVRIYEIRNT